MVIVPDGMIGGDGTVELSLSEKIAIIVRNLPTAADYAALRMRAVNFTRQAPGSARELPAQHAVFTAACAARGWTAGGSVGQIGDGLRAWSAVIRLVHNGTYDVVVVDTWDRLAATEAGRMRVLGMLRDAGVRLLIARDGIDTADWIGAGLVDSLIGPPVVGKARAAASR